MCTRQKALYFSEFQQGEVIYSARVALEMRVELEFWCSLLTSRLTILPAHDTAFFISKGHHADICMMNGCESQFCLQISHRGDRKGDNLGKRDDLGSSWACLSPQSAGPRFSADTAQQVIGPCSPSPPRARAPFPSSSVAPPSSRNCDKYLGFCTSCVFFRWCSGHLLHLTRLR